MGLSGAERQARYRARREAEWRELRRRAASAPGGAHAPHDALEQAICGRDAALKRVADLEAELRRALAQPTGPEISKPLFRWLLGELHPDRNVDPATKEYLHEVFIRFQARVAGGGEGRLPTKEEMMQNRAETYRKNRERGLKGAATRKKNQEAKQAAAGDNGTSGGK